MELTKKTKALAEEQRTVVSTAKMLEEAARERTQLTAKHYEKIEWAKMVLHRVQTKFLDYEV